MTYQDVVGRPAAVRSVFVVIGLVPRREGRQLRATKRPWHGSGSLPFVRLADETNPCGSPPQRFASKAMYDASSASVSKVSGSFTPSTVVRE